MVEPAVFLFLGSDESGKQKRLALLNNKLFPASLKDLNTTVLYADDKSLTPRVLKEALTSLPTQGASKRLVIIKMAHKLSRDLAACLDQTVGAATGSTVLVLDVPEVRGAEAWAGAWRKRGAEALIFKSDVAADVFGLGRAIVARQTDNALKILGDIFSGRERPEKIVGGLLWQWERSRSDRRLSEEAYAHGLKYLCEADKRLKTSSVAHRQERLILETLVVKLSCLR